MSYNPCAWMYDFHVMLPVRWSTKSIGPNTVLQAGGGALG